MKRASFTAACVLCFTALFLWRFPAAILPTVIVSAVLSAVSLCFFLFIRRRWLRDCLYALICLLLSALVLWFPVKDFYDTAQTYDGLTVTATVTLTEDPQLCSTGNYRYVARPDPSLFSQKLMFYSPVYYTDAGGTVTATFSFFRADDGFAGEGCSEGVALFATLDTPAEEVVCSDGNVSFYSLSGSLRRYVHKTFLRFLGKTEGGFMTAVLTGEKEALSEDHYEALEQTGMLHIVAVSGLHVSIFISFVLFLLQKVPNPRWSIALSALSLGLILLLAGFTPSVLRAVIMNGVVFLHQWFSTGSDPFNRLGIAAILIVLFSPYSVLSLSFQLSFAAAFGILLLSSAILSSIARWLLVRFRIIFGSALRSLVELFSVSVAAFSFTFPIVWLRFGSYSVWSVILSPVILPVLQICFVLALILLILSPIPLLSFLCRFCGIIIVYGVKFMTILAANAASLVDVAENLSPALIWVVAGAALLMAALLFFLPSSKTGSKKKKRLMIRRGVALLLSVFALFAAYQAADSVSSDLAVGEVAPSPGVLQTAFLDVGQGNCFVSVMDKEACVVDCGGTKEPGKTAADYLTSAGIDTVKFVLISHLHSDHANGLEDLCEEKEILEIIIPYTEGDASLYARITALAEEEGAVLTVLSEDAQRTLGSAVLRMLTRHLDPTSDDQNENSIVGLFEYDNFRAMFTGDITSAAEKRLVSAYGSGLDCDVLSVPHHGSKGSSCSTFIKATSPVYAVISVGLNNSYGHPTEEAMDRISEEGATLLRTDELGTVTIRSDGQKMEVVSSDES